MPNTVLDAIRDLQNTIIAEREAVEKRLKAIEKNLSTGEIDNEVVKIRKDLDANQDELLNLKKDIDEKIKQLEALREPPQNSEAREREIEDSRELISLIKDIKIEDVQPDVEFLKNYRKSFEAYIRKNIVNQDDMRSSEDPKGGYWIEPAVSRKIVELVYETSDVRPIVTIETIGTSSQIGLHDTDEFNAGWVGETEERSQTDAAKIGEYEIGVKEVYAEPWATQNMLDDTAWNVTAWFARKVSRKMARMENKAFLMDHTQKRPRGMLTYPVAETEIEHDNFGDHVEMIKSGADGEVSNPDALIELTGTLKNEYQRRARFAMNRSMLTKLRQLKDGDGRYFFVPDFSISPFGMILGRPISSFEDLTKAVKGTAGTAFNAILYGDFSEYYKIIERQGLRTIRDIITKKGYVKFYTTKRVGGDVVNFDAVKILQLST